jgi:hypothetical protein
VVLLLPRGIIPSVEELIERWRTRSAAPDAGPEEPGRTGDAIKTAGVR